MVNLLLETLFIGVYSLVLFSILFLVIKKPFYLVLFILGIMKHALGYFTGLQTFYCQSYLGPNEIAVSPTLSDVFIEGVLYIAIGSLLYRFIKNPYIVVFLTGVGLHLGFEVLGIHSFFLRTRCIPV